jgi:hypothetical protein
MAKSQLSIENQPVVGVIVEWCKENWVSALIAFCGYFLVAAALNQPYYFLKEAARFLLYAVLIQVITADLPLDEITDFSEINAAQALFLYLSVGIVLLSLFIEQWVEQVLGPLVAIQFLSLAVVASRLYVAWKKHGPEFFQKESTKAKHFIYVSAVGGFLIPVCIRILIAGPWILPPLNLRYPTNTTTAFSLMAALSIGASSYLFFEEFNGPRKVQRWMSNV